jgi:hypothetical protein
MTFPSNVSILCNANQARYILGVGRVQLVKELWLTKINFCLNLTAMLFRQEHLKSFHFFLFVSMLCDISTLFD